jgi:hypothetical protein
MPDGTKLSFGHLLSLGTSYLMRSYEDVLNGIITFHETDLFKWVMIRGENVEESEQIQE